MNLPKHIRREIHNIWFHFKRLTNCLYMIIYSISEGRYKSYVQQLYHIHITKLVTFIFRNIDGNVSELYLKIVYSYRFHLWRFSWGRRVDVDDGDHHSEKAVFCRLYSARHCIACSPRTNKNLTFNKHLPK